MGSFGLFRRWLAALALCASLVPAAQAAQPANPPAADPFFDAKRGVFSYAKVLARVLPAVVQITLVATEARAGRAAARRAAADRRISGRPTERVVASGSGVIIDAQKGYVLTNDHVVTPETRKAGRVELKVALRDGREFTGEVVGRDPLTDIALVKIPARHLTAIDIIDSSTLEVGDVVLAVGYPLGLDQSVTVGVVSGLSRHFSDTGLQDFIQTDAAINHGNSGGALVDTQGRLVGINTSIANPYGEGNIGLNFAVPTHIAMDVSAQLARYGTVHRGQIGIAATDLTPPLAKAIGAAVMHGALITKVDAGFSAAKSGLRPGDIVVRAAETEVRSAADLRNVVGLTETGQSIAVSFYRDGREEEVTITIPALIRRHEERIAKLAQPERAKADETTLFGATFRPIPAGHRLDGRAYGVIVAAVAAGSQAQDQGLKPGDLVVSVNKRAVRDLPTFEQAIAAATDAVALRIVHGRSVRIAVFSRARSS